MKNYIIIGTGVAGISAAQTIRRQDPAANIVVIGDEPEIYYSRPGLAYYLTKELPEKGLFPISRKEIARQNIRILEGRVTRINAQEQRVELSTRNFLSYDRLLIATGARATKMKLPGSELNGVVKLDSLVDARNIAKLARKARSAVVIGGGITALEIVEGLVARGVKPHYFLRHDRYWANVLDETESRIVEHRLREEGVKIHYRTEATEIVGKRGRVAGVITKDGERIACRIVAIAIGIRPRIGLAAAIDLNTDRGILVDEYLQTSQPGIYAAGDVAQVYDPLSGQYNIDSLWGPARQQGEVAGLNMAGIKTSYYKSAPFNVTRLAGLTTSIIGTVGRGNDPDLFGIARGDSETWRQLPDAIAAQAGFDVNRLRIMVGEKHLLGAIIMGNQTLSHPLQHLVAQKADITSIRDKLLQPGADISDIMIDFWTNWRQKYAAQ